MDLVVLENLEEMECYHRYSSSRRNVQRRCWDIQDLLTDLPIAEEHDELLETHFGISVSTRIWRSKGISATNNIFTHAAYLTLPNNITRVDKWEVGNFDYMGFMGFGMPVDIHAPPTKQSLSRFPRALKILGLQAWSHPGLKDQPILSPSVTGEEEKEIGGMDIVQPRLTFLVETG